MYIKYTMDQLFLPMDLEEDIPRNHLVRVVNAAINRLDDAIFNAVYIFKKGHMSFFCGVF
ncbi:hypothetical protein [Paenibacillus pseudetheri]|uniref:Transposase n=1 Tax=Paenibacillus pseudetheri TaxID=2897682 RepID=A0ABN8FDD8_9BACL|nr:hypothetical protein [Paenibacillus pseudetheri]CAH1056046.1 hypothetical protein PAECIP111894_02199 [Paenibacillus pseudetheri]